MLMVSACPEPGFLGHAARPRATKLTGHTVLVVLMCLAGLPRSRDTPAGTCGERCAAAALVISNRPRR